MWFSERRGRSAHNGLAEIVWTVLSVLTSLWGLLAGSMPSMGWVNVILMAAFAVAFGYFYMQQES